MKTITYEGYWEKVVRSLLWSAYGDALGFITELRDNTRGIHARIGTERATQTMPWHRRVGGRFGVEALLPAGCYSDDTQLRLATARALRPDATLNIEAFAKMELPVWTCYALGAGRGSKAAAVALSREGVTWFSNFYQSDGLSYFAGGGNGAAMRIQPHVWASSEATSNEEIIAQIFRNAVCTHGHIRGIAGAIFHGMCLRYVCLQTAIPGFEDWEEAVDYLTDLPRIAESDPDLNMFWLPVREQHVGRSFSVECASVKEEMLTDIRVLKGVFKDRNGNPEELYRRAVQDIGACAEAQRGSGTKTTLLAAFLCYLYADKGTEGAIICAANALSSDTDTIATMAGAMLGFVEKDTPSHPIADKDYLVREAKRMAAIGFGHETVQTDYPNLLNWVPPRTQQDSVVEGERGLEVLVLGHVEEEGAKFERDAKDLSLWQWLRLESGQSILAKRRKKPRKMTLPPEQLRLEADPRPEAAEDLVPDLNALTKKAIASHFNATLIGKHILHLASTPDGIEKVIAYAAIVAKARLVRTKHD